MTAATCDSCHLIGVATAGEAREISLQITDTLAADSLNTLAVEVRPVTWIAGRATYTLRIDGNTGCETNCVVVRYGGQAGCGAGA